MILSVGEILADMIGENNGGNMQFSAYCGGAPFNMAVNAHLAGAKVGFIGRVGNDPIGRFVTEQAAKAKLEMLDIQQDDERNTTIAFVTLTNGERDFAFYRHDTADYHIDAEKIDFGGIKDLTTVHLGSLMLSEDKGRQVAEEIVAKTKQVGALLSFDMNFRMDIYKDFEEAKKSYQPFVMQADILKFSEDELADYTDIADMDAAVESLNKPNSLIVVTLGSKGSAYYCNGIKGVVPSQPIKPVDTTGAGDAFFGTFVACMENKQFNKANIEEALVKANRAGAKATQFKGAIEL